MGDYDSGAGNIQIFGPNDYAPRPTPTPTNSPNRTPTATPTLTLTPGKTPTPTHTPSAAVANPADADSAMVDGGPGSPTATDRAAWRAVAVPNISTGGEPIQFLVNLELPEWIYLSIYDLAGERVYNASMEGNTGSNKLVWPLQNRGGAGVASGLYIYALRIENEEGLTAIQTGKVAVMH